MAKFIIGNDFINFYYDNRSFAAHITRMITSEKIIFNIDYSCIDSPEYGKCQVSYSTNEITNQLEWMQHENGNSDDFIKAIGIAIEKNKELLNTA